MSRRRAGRNEAQHWLTLLSGLTENLLISGLAYGWAALVYVLKVDGHFSEYCINATREEQEGVSTDCSGQDEQFTKIMNVALFINISTRFFVGLIFDCCGTAASRLIAISLHLVGTLFISTFNTDTSFLLYAAMPCLIVSGSILHMTNTQVANLFDSHRSTVITIYTGAFDTSAAVCLVIKLLHERGVSLHASFLCLTLCSVGLLLRTFYLMPRGHIPHPLPQDYTYGVGCPGRRRARRTEENGPNEEITHLEMNQKEETAEAEMSASHPPPAAEQEGEGSLQSCVFSWLFLWHLVWMVVNLFCQSIFLAHVNASLTRLADGDQSLVSHYTNVFGLVQLSGLLVAPLNGAIMDRHRRRPLVPGASSREADLRSSSLALFLTALQCVLFCVCFTCPVLPLQYLTFVLQVFNCNFFYGCHYAFVNFAFPSCHFGKISGIGMTISGLVLLLQFPLQHLVQHQLRGDPLYVNVGVTLVSLLTFCHPLHVSLYCRKLANQRQTEPEEPEVKE